MSDPNVIVELVLLFPVTILAVNQAVETWNHGDIFAEWREWAEQSEGRFAQLFSCMFCLSHWVAFVLSAIVFCALDFVFNETWLLWLIYSLGVARGAQWLNDFGHSYIRTPKPPSAEELAHEFSQLNKIGREPEEKDIE